MASAFDILREEARTFEEGERLLRTTEGYGERERTRDIVREILTTLTPSEIQHQIYLNYETTWGIEVRFSHIDIGYARVAGEEGSLHWKEFYPLRFLDDEPTGNRVGTIVHCQILLDAIFEEKLKKEGEVYHINPLKPREDQLRSMGIYERLRKGSWIRGMPAEEYLRLSLNYARRNGLRFEDPQW